MEYSTSKLRLLAGATGAREPDVHEASTIPNELVSHSSR